MGCECGNGCTWQNCRWGTPPADCLNDVPQGAEWKWNQELKLYEAKILCTGKIFNHWFFFKLTRYANSHSTYILTSSSMKK